MSLFAKPKVVLWPKSKSTEIYQDKKENNTLSFDLDLWQPKTDAELQTLIYFFKQNKITEVSVLIPDDIVLTKSFIYDSQIAQIDKKEVIGLAESFVPFKIDPDSITYNLVQLPDKTIIQSSIYEKSKTDHLQTNLAKVGVKVSEMKPVSAAIAEVISTFYNQEYFLLYPFETNEYTLMLSKGNSVYLTANYKGPNLDIQKIINYSNLYFSSPISKIFVPSESNFELVSTTTLDKTLYNQNQIALDFHKPGNLPLPVLALFIDRAAAAPAIIPHTPQPAPESPNINSPKPTKPTMENKRNILPVIAVFVFTAALASIIIWFVLNRNSSTTADNTEPASQVTPTVAPTDTPSVAPTPTLAAVPKTSKLQVLNATDINGQAATVKSMLTKLGFTSIAVGNAKANATANSIQVKASKPDIGEYFRQSLAGQFDATVDPTLPETSTYDAVFVIGTDLRGVAAPTSAVSTETTPVASPTASKKVTPTPTKSVKTTLPSATPTVAR
ncbi:MAG TPA: LytR C-terminal domain-containing protein [Patescibacteria group bacterium]